MLYKLRCHCGFAATWLSGNPKAGSVGGIHPIFDLFVLKKPITGSIEMLFAKSFQVGTKCGFRVT
jgi:hypothetical protein